MIKRNTLAAAIAVIGMSVCAAQAPAASYDFTYQTGRTFDYGGHFSKTVSHFVGTTWRNANVQLSGWDLDYRFGDHHIDRARVQIKNKYYNKVSGYVSFTIEGSYHDKNLDDDFYWDVQYTVLMTD